MQLKEVLTDKKGDSMVYFPFYHVDGVIKLYLILLIKIVQNGTKRIQDIINNIHVYHNIILIHNSQTYLIHNYVCTFST